MKIKEIKRLIAQAESAKKRGDNESYHRIYCQLAETVKHSHSVTAKLIRTTVKSFSAEEQLKYQIPKRKKVKSRNPVQILFSIDQDHAPVEQKEQQDLHQELHQELKVNLEQKTTQEQDQNRAQLRQRLEKMLDNLEQYKQAGFEHMIFSPLPDDENFQAEFQAALSRRKMAMLKAFGEIVATGNLGMVMIYLLQQGREFINKIDDQGYAPIHYLSVCCKTLKDFIEVFSLLKNQGADINIQTNKGLTLLHMLVANHTRTFGNEQESLQAIAFLLSQDCNPNIASRDHITPLVTAARNQNLVLVSLLVEGGATADLKGIPGVAFEMFANSGNIAALNCLLQGNAALAVSFDLEDKWMKQLDAGNGVVLAYINGKFSSDLKTEFKLPGLQKAYAGMDEVIMGFIKGKMSEQLFNIVLRKSILISYPDASEEFIKEQVQNTHQQINEIKVAEKRSQFLHETMASPNFKPSDEKFNREFQTMIQYASEVQQRKNKVNNTKQGPATENKRPIVFSIAKGKEGKIASLNSAFAPVAGK